LWILQNDIVSTRITIEQDCHKCFCEERFWFEIVRQVEQAVYLGEAALFGGHFLDVDRLFCSICILVSDGLLLFISSLVSSLALHALLTQGKKRQLNSLWCVSFGYFWCLPFVGEFRQVKLSLLLFS